jgi:hypothetical protein
MHLEAYRPTWQDVSEALLGHYTPTARPTWLHILKNIKTEGELSDVTNTIDFYTGGQEAIDKTIRTKNYYQENLEQYFKKFDNTDELVDLINSSKSLNKYITQYLSEDNSYSIYTLVNNQEFVKKLKNEVRSGLKKKLLNSRYSIIKVAYENPIWCEGKSEVSYLLTIDASLKAFDS